VALFGNGVFADEVPLRRGHDGGPNAVGLCLSKKDKFHKEPQRQGCVEAEVGGCSHIKATEHRGPWVPPEARKRQERVLLRVSEEE
jgi:hypothetical protein